MEDLSDDVGGRSQWNRGGCSEGEVGELLGGPEIEFGPTRSHHEWQAVIELCLVRYSVNCVVVRGCDDDGLVRCQRRCYDVGDICDLPVPGGPVTTVSTLVIARPTASFCARVAGPIDWFGQTPVKPA